MVRGLSIVVLLLIVAIAIMFLTGAWQSRGPGLNSRMKQRSMPEGKKQIVLRKLIHAGKEDEAIRKTQLFYGITKREAEDYIRNLKKETLR
ncbi:hypothetical protein QR721_10595 [Aciduricibacillus chroicocephali]|uniref:50S ribosomal protein L7/L12 n=1 Tax=Aciduricibacillus chroicocephali TaxID=3054939 RepID=A0ABY9KTE0_9BACI|nr:hypothetical protein QR721_10595 [Bacillaceae bacterium 44XB]